MKFVIAMEELNQHKQALERASETMEANEKISRPGRHRPIRPVGLELKSQTGRAGFFDRSDRSLPKSPQSKLQMVNLDQMKSKFDET